MRPAIDHYHELLTPDVAEASHAMLEDQLRRRHLLFGDRPLCTVLRPRFISPERLRTLSAGIRVLLDAFGRAHQAAVADPLVRRQFRLTDWEEALLPADPGFASPSPHGRLDCFENGTGFALTEYNAETPAGAGFNDSLSDCFAVLPVMRAFRRRFAVRPLPGRPGVATVLLDCWREFSGGWGRPRVAIVDWEGVPTSAEFVIFRDYLTSLGLATVIVDPRALQYRGGRLYHPDGPIDLVYKRVLIHELIQREGLEHPLVRAVRDRSVCMVNSFRCKLLHKKASLAVLSDEQNARLFTTEQRLAVRAHIPWTRVVEERHTVFADERIELIPFILQHRERLVLKPNDDYGGAGVVLGWTVDAGAWETGVRAALASPSIVQERVAIPAEPYPSMGPGGLELADRMYDTAPFVLHGATVEGSLTRLSTAALLNVTAGGGSMVPCFLVEAEG